MIYGINIEGMSYVKKKYLYLSRGWWVIKYVLLVMKTICHFFTYFFFYYIYSIFIFFIFFYFFVLLIFFYLFFFYGFNLYMLLLSYLKSLIKKNKIQKRVKRERMGSQIQTIKMIQATSCLLFQYDTCFMKPVYENARSIK